MRFFSLPVLFLFLSLKLSGQILKVDKSHLASDSSNYLMGSLRGNFALDNRSNSPTEQIIYTRFSAYSDLVYVAEKHAYIFVSNLEYLNFSGGTPISNGYLHIRTNLFRKRKLSYELYSQAQYDRSRRMPLRLLEGGGLRLTVLKTDNIDIHIGSGLMWELEDWKETDSTDVIIEKRLMKSSNYLGSEFKLNKIRLNLQAYYQTGYDVNTFRHRYSAQAVLSLPITKYVFFENQVSMAYDVKPIIPLNRLIFSVSNGIRVNF